MIDAFCSHPDYLTDRGAQLAAGSITKRVVGQLVGHDLGMGMTFMLMGVFLARCVGVIVLCLSEQRGEREQQQGGCTQ